MFKSIKSSSWLRSAPAVVLRRIDRIASTINMDVSNISIRFKKMPLNVGGAMLHKEEVSLDFQFFDPSKINDLEFTLLHELRHIQQSRRGLLSSMMGGFYWKQEFHEKIGDSDQYYLTPWENDANSYAMNLMSDAQLQTIPFVQKIIKVHIEHGVPFEIAF